MALYIAQAKKSVYLNWFVFDLNAFYYFVRAKSVKALRFMVVGSGLNLELVVMTGDELASALEPRAGPAAGIVPTGSSLEVNVPPEVEIRCSSLVLENPQRSRVPRLWNRFLAFHQQRWVV